MPEKTAKVFISYSHRDRKWLDRLKVHLKPLERQKRLEIWEDTRLRVGDDWQEEIKKAMASAEVCLLLVSADFLASDFVADKEIPFILEAAKDRNALIVPILLSPSDFENTPGINCYQAKPGTGRTLAEMSKAKQARELVELSKEIREALKARELRPPEEPPSKEPASEPAPTEAEKAPPDAGVVPLLSESVVASLSNPEPTSSPISALTDPSKVNEALQAREQHLPDEPPCEVHEPSPNQSASIPMESEGVLEASIKLEPTSAPSSIVEKSSTGEALKDREQSVPEKTIDEPIVPLDEPISDLSAVPMESVPVSISSPVGKELALEPAPDKVEDKHSILRTPPVDFIFIEDESVLEDSIKPEPTSAPSSIVEESSIGEASKDREQDVPEKTIDEPIVPMVEPISDLSVGPMKPSDSAPVFRSSPVGKELALEPAPDKVEDKHSILRTPSVDFIFIEDESVLEDSIKPEPTSAPIKRLFFDIIEYIFSIGNVLFDTILHLPVALWEAIHKVVTTLWRTISKVVTALLSALLAMIVVLHPLPYMCYQAGVPIQLIPWKVCRLFIWKETPTKLFPPQPGTVATDERTGLSLVDIPAGLFWMGSDTYGSDTSPKHLLFLPKYRIGATEVTVAQFRRYCKTSGYRYDWDHKMPSWGYIEDYPMVNVDWNEALSYCKWAGGSLPTEAEWEKAARGTDSRLHPWGDGWDVDKSVNSINSSYRPASVASKSSDASPYGVLGMAGNVREWCSDIYIKDAYIEASRLGVERIFLFRKREPTYQGREHYKSVRGNSWLDKAQGGCVNRSSYDPTHCNSDIGFRPVFR